MYIMCFNVSICFKLGSLYSYCDIITRLVYPPELSRIAGFCTNFNKIFLGSTPDPLSSRIIWGCIINHNTANLLKKVKNTYPNPPPTIFLANSRSNGLCMSYLKSPLLIIFSQMDVWKNKEKSLKTPWKCTSKVLEKSLKKVCHDLWEPWFCTSVLKFIYNTNWAASLFECLNRVMSEKSICKIDNMW